MIYVEIVRKWIEQWMNEKLLGINYNASLEAIPASSTEAYLWGMKYWLTFWELMRKCFYIVLPCLVRCHTRYNGLRKRSNGSHYWDGLLQLNRFLDSVKLCRNSPAESAQCKWIIEAPHTCVSKKRIDNWYANCEKSSTSVPPMMNWLQCLMRSARFIGGLADE